MAAPVRTARTPGTHLPEDRLEEVAETAPSRPAASSEHLTQVEIGRESALPSGWRSEVGPRFPIGSELVITLALLGITQDVVGFLDFFELILCALVVGVDVWMVLAGELPVGFFDFVVPRGPSNSESFVIVLKLYRHRSDGGQAPLSLFVRYGNYRIRSVDPET